MRQTVTGGRLFVYRRPGNIRRQTSLAVPPAACSPEAPPADAKLRVAELEAYVVKSIGHTAASLSVLSVVSNCPGPTQP
jgi:hypothetical protein